MALWELTRSRGEYMVVQMIIGVVAVLVLPLAVTVNWQWLWATLAVIVLFNVVLVEGYMHRWCSHRTYVLSKPMEYLLAFLASVVPGTGSTAGWAALHKAHHSEVDTERDPHSPLHMSFWQMATWRYPNIGTLHSSRRLLADPVHKAIHKYYLVWMVLWAVLWSLIAGVNGLLFVVLLPWAIGPLMSVIQNIGLHSKLPFSYRNYDTPDHSQNSVLMHLFSFGCVGWHNNHHAKPGSITIKKHWWEFDTAAWFIRLVRKK